MVGALLHAYHFLDFAGILHGFTASLGIMGGVDTNSL